MGWTLFVSISGCSLFDFKLWMLNWEVIHLFLLFLYHISCSADVDKLKKLVLHNPHILTLPEVELKDDIVPRSVQQSYVKFSLSSVQWYFSSWSVLRYWFFSFGEINLFSFPLLRCYPENILPLRCSSNSQNSLVALICWFSYCQTKLLLYSTLWCFSV